MYRAIKSINGGEEVEGRHFNSLSDAYYWLQPALWRQMRDSWHLKMLHAVKVDFEANKAPNGYEMIGYDEVQEKPMFLYIQRVQHFSDPWPHDI
jgi:hypothetical protein